MLRYPRVNADIFMDTFFVWKDFGKSTRHNQVTQLFITDFSFIYVVPLKGKGLLPFALKDFFKHVGVPPQIICDGAREQVKGGDRRLCQLSSCLIWELEKDTPWSNRAELFIGILKSMVQKYLHHSHWPMVLCDFCCEYCVRILNLTIKSQPILHGMVPQTMMTGQPTGILDICVFGWYEWCYFQDTSHPFPQQVELLGRVLGPAKSAGNAMSQWVMNDKGNILP
mmetsp:Transcript_1849/g.3782  ORF Transcript_1849/g.3782 Transcript_1849/m.3782 type:complete len:225 (-) Transcript_1849:2857-3531(-)